MESYKKYIRLLSFVLLIFKFLSGIEAAQENPAEVNFIKYKIMIHHQIFSFLTLHHAPQKLSLQLLR